MMRSRESVTAAVFCCVLSGLVDGASIRTQSVADAGPDYAVQGEYIGSLMRGADPALFGVQVIALGKGSFKAVGYPGGLPGAGWSAGEKLRFSGATRGGETLLTMADGRYSLTIRAQEMVVTDAAGKVAGRLQRIVRISPTLGRKPPEGALVLFDGTTAEHFRTAGNKPAAMTADGLLRLTSGSGGLFTRRPFQSCTLHLEFRLPFEPEGRGQGRANSGCYLQGRYEVQILDSFGLEGRENECGGMYSSGADPKVNMCFPPLTWQTYDIEFTAPQFNEDGKKIADARLTVYHNGVLVYLEQKIGHVTTASPEKKEVPAPKPHYLQDHGHELLFKNIWVVER